jgi:hypothetical protein
MNKLCQGLTTCFSVFFIYSGCLGASPLDIHSSTLNFSQPTPVNHDLHKLKLDAAKVDFNSKNQTLHIKELVHHHLSSKKLKVFYIGDINTSIEKQINMTGVKEATHISVVDGNILELHSPEQAEMLVEHKEQLPVLVAVKDHQSQKVGLKVLHAQSVKTHPKLASKTHPKLASKTHPKLTSKTHPKLASKDFQHSKAVSSPPIRRL